MAYQDLPVLSSTELRDLIVSEVKSILEDEEREQFNLNYDLDNQEILIKFLMANDNTATMKMKTTMKRLGGQGGSNATMQISNNGVLHELTIEDKSFTQKQIYSNGMKELEPLMKYLLNEYDFY